MEKNPIKLILCIGLMVLFTHTVKAEWVQTNGPANTNVNSLTVSDSNIFAGTDSGVFLSNNNGTNWTAVDSGLTNQDVSFLAVNGSTIFAGAEYYGVFRSTNNGKSWTAVDSGLPTDLYSKYYINTLAASGINVFVGTDSGVFLSANSGTSWTAASSGLTNDTILSLAVCGNNIFAGTNGGVFLSANNGTNWTKANSGLTNDTVQSFAVSDSDIFAGTKHSGIFLSKNNGTSWTAVNSGLTDNDITSLAVSGTDIFAGTSGSGVWRRSLTEITGVINPKSRQGMLQQTLFEIHSPNHVNPNLSIDFSLPHSEQVTIKIFNLSGHQVASLVNKHLGSGSYTYLWNTKNLSAGCYSVRMQVGTNTFVKSLPIIR